MEVREKLISPCELAAMLGVKRGTIYVWRQRKQIPEGVKICGARRLKLSEIRDFFGFNNELKGGTLHE